MSQIMGPSEGPTYGQMGQNIVPDGQLNTKRKSVPSLLYKFDD
jgi:hypothetical protein